MGIYALGITELPAGHAETMLDQSVRGANALIGRLTDPGVYENASGHLDIDEQLITWASVRFGYDALNSVATQWGASDAVWSAFRALGILQGLWEGHRNGAVPLSELLNPKRLRAHVLPALTDLMHHRWAAALIDNYQKELTSGFATHDVDEAARQMQELRNLVHGVGAQGRRPRDVRLASLRLLARHTPNVQLVCDIASLWWSALLLAPAQLFRPGRAPWEH